jgi:DNA-binding transcriptional LysR family regulator
MVATRRGEDLRAPVRRLLREANALLRAGEAFDPATSDRSFALALTEYCHAVLSGPLIAHVAATAPGATLELLHHGDQDRIEGLDGGRVDLLIGGSTEPGAGLARGSLFTDRLVLAQRKGHPRGLAPVAADATADLDYIAVCFAGSPLDPVAEATQAALGRPIDARVRIASFVAAVDALAASDLVAPLPRRIACAHRDVLDFVEFDYAMPALAIEMVWSDHVEQDAGHRWLRETVCRIAAEC